MITENDLAEAIAECQGARNPNAGTCIKLASLLTIRDKMFPMYSKIEEDRGKSEFSGGYSYADDPVKSVEKISYISDTEFSKEINGRDPSEIWSIIDELMTVLEATNPRLYNGVMRKISE